MSAKTLAIFTGSVLAAAAVGWHLAFSGGGTAGRQASDVSIVLNRPEAPAPASGAAAGAAKQVPEKGWVPPTGDPVQRYRAARTPEERIQVISDFITLGHDRNVFMLQEAVRDSDARVRMLALERAASMLAPELAREVYRVSGRSDDPDIRTMTWSFLAPHPMENRVAVYGEVLQKGPDVAVEETLSEMGRTPEMPLFDAMLFQSLGNDMKPARVDRLLQEMNTWLKPGGGNVPEFHSVAELQSWWQANRQRYDQFLLRVDQ